MTDQARKKQLKKAWQAEVQRQFEASLPMSKEAFKTLFDALDEALETDSCDHSNQYTLKILSDMKISDIEKVTLWLKDHGGYCDREVLWNVEDHFQ